MRWRDLLGGPIPEPAPSSIAGWSGAGSVSSEARHRAARGETSAGKGLYLRVFMLLALELWMRIRGSHGKTETLAPAGLDRHSLAGTRRRYIAACLDSILASDYPQDRLEILVADGQSTDGTRGILIRYAARHPRSAAGQSARAPRRPASTVAIRAASGDIVIRMDAHVLYPRTTSAGWSSGLEETGADNVGGVLETLPADDTPHGSGDRIGLSHPFRCRQLALPDRARRSVGKSIRCRSAATAERSSTASACSTRS